MEKHTQQQRKDINTENERRHMERLARRADGERMKAQQKAREKAKHEQDKKSKKERRKK
jgi:hypothetical protein